MKGKQKLLVPVEEIPASRYHLLKREKHTGSGGASKVKIPGKDRRSNQRGSLYLP